MSIAESWKALGNQAYQAGQYTQAIEHFSKAIEVDPKNATYYCNRSLAYASLKQWVESAKDAKEAIQIDVKYIKAHFRLCKALIQLSKWREVRLAVLYAIKECGENKDIKVIEEEIAEKTGIAVRPKSSDFEIVAELGNGNYSKIYKTYHKKTKKVYAIKTIERQTVDRMKRRHPNINNEILMEKRVLQKLEHPGVVQLFATFQDYGTLYYQMEFIGGCDLWTALHEMHYDQPYTIRDIPLRVEDEEVDPELEADENYVSKHRKGKRGAQVGLPWSLLRFYMAEIINALEHFHRKGIVHRDIKPENIIITQSGHVKFIDFGTAKDLVQRDLNGQDFVGTPEYMSPETVYVKNNKKTAPEKEDDDVRVEEVTEESEAKRKAEEEEKKKKKESEEEQPLEIGFEADHWALGVMLHQLVFGFTPFLAPSPYLVFLRIKRDLLMMPSWTPKPIADLIRLFLTKDPKERMQHCIGEWIDCKQSNPAVYNRISYDTLRQHAFFTKWHEEVHLPQQQHYAKLYGSTTGQDSTSLSDMQGVKDVYDQPAQRIPTLHELCLRAVADAAVKVAFATSDNGGIRPKGHWMQHFQLQKLSSLDFHRVSHLLDRRQQLHIPSVFRLFHNSLPESRCKRANKETKEIVGFTRQLQGHYTTDFHFIQVANPMLGSTEVDGHDESYEESKLKNLISNVNKIRPKFFVCFGNFTVNGIEDAKQEELWNRFRKCMARVSDTIPVILVPGRHEMGEEVTKSQLEKYREYFGADYFSFWYQGMKAMVINSTLMLHGFDHENQADHEESLAEAALQDLWLEEEIEQAKLCSTTIVLFSYHPFFYESLDEEDMDVDLVHQKIRSFPKALRHKWLHKLRHHKVKFVFSAVNEVVEEEDQVKAGKGIKVFAKKSEVAEIPTIDEMPKDVKEEESESDDDDTFENVDGSYEGPTLLINPVPSTGTTSSSQQFPPAYRLVLVKEEDIQHACFAGEKLPASMQQALDFFKEHQ